MAPLAIFVKPSRAAMMEITKKITAQSSIPKPLPCLSAFKFS